VGLFRIVHDWFWPRSESTNECLRREVREKVHSFRNQAMVESAQLKRAQDHLSEVSRATRRTIKRLELAKLRLERDGREHNG
jgi:hypothetical protein